MARYKKRKLRFGLRAFLVVKIRRLFLFLLFRSLREPSKLGMDHPSGATEVRYGARLLDLFYFFNARLA